jgi:hypothetical protein
MIPVTPAQEPPSFNDKVRRPGLAAIGELVGELPLEPKPGRKRPKIAEKREDIPPDKFPPIWTEALPDLLTAYNRICAYTTFRIEKVTSSGSVDHMIPKSLAWDKVYEWSNYRLACAIMNTRKGKFADVLDPFDVKAGWFELELIGFEILPSAALRGELRSKVDYTIARLGLNDYDCRERRHDDAQDYWHSEITFNHLERRSPFVALEIKRQRKLRTEDMFLLYGED